MPDLSSKQLEEEHFAAIGRLITAYAYLDGYFHVALRRVSGIDDKIGRLILGGMRLRDVTERLRKLTKHDPRHSLLANCIDQASIIGDARDLIAHRRVTIKESLVTVSNIDTARTKLLHEEHIFTLRQLQLMEYDCKLIVLRIGHFLNRPSRLAPDIQDLLEIPWFYKPDAQARKDPRGAPDAKSMRRRPRSSRQKVQKESKPD